MIQTLKKTAQLGTSPASGYSGEDVAFTTDSEPAVIEFEVVDEDPAEFSFALPKIPGADDDSEIVVEPVDSDIEVEEPKDVVVEENDPWDWQSQGMGNFLEWLQGMMNSVPGHSGKDTTGLEKAITYFEALDREITKAMRSDYKNEIDAASCERCREEIEGGLERLVDRLEKVKSSKFKRHSKKSKKADVESEQIVKEAGATRITGITITVPLFISFIARTLINGHVSAGHDMENMYQKLDKKYKFTDVQKAELTQLMQDMGFPLRLDRGRLDEEFDISSSNNFDWAASFNNG